MKPRRRLPKQRLMPLDRRMRQLKRSARVKGNAVIRVHPGRRGRRAKIKRKSRLKAALRRRVNRIVPRAKIVLKAAVRKAVVRKAIVLKEDLAEAGPNGVRIAVEIGIVAVGFNGVSAILMPTSNWNG